MITRPDAGTAAGLFPGLWNHAFCPRYQMAVQSPQRSATAYCWPVETREDRSFTPVVGVVPRPTSLISGAFTSWSEYSRTSLEPCGAQGSPAVSQPVYPGRLAS